MPYKHWFVSRQKRQLTSVLPALIAFSDVCVGKKWAPELQLAFEDELARRSITEHGKLRARKAGTGGGGTRTLFKQMKDLGLVFAEDETGLCRLTLIAEALVKGEITFADAMRLQLQKYQYPSAACWSGTGSVDHSFKIHPFQFLLRLLRDKRLSNYLTADEIAYIVISEASSDSSEVFENVVSKILDSRQAENPFGIEKKADEKKALYNIANTFCNYLSLTQYIDRGYMTISVRDGKEDLVDSFIQPNAKFIPNPELTENYIRSYGRGNAAKDLRVFDKTDNKSQKEIREARIRKEYVLLALRTPITGITSDVVQEIAESTGFDEKEIEKFLIRNYPNGNTEDFFVAYKELAQMGREGASDFEKATCEMFRKIFHMRAEHIGPKGNTPDVFVESNEAGYCGIIDNKAYHKGYSISGAHKRVMEDVYIPNYRLYSGTIQPLAFFSYIAGSFGKNIDSQVREIAKDTSVNGSAMPVDILINFAQDYAERGFDHYSVKSLFSVNREARLTDLEQQYSFSFEECDRAAEADDAFSSESRNGR